MSDNDQPLVSIITPTFPGRETELRRCVQRVKDLDWPRIQHVIVSDRNPAINAHHAYERVGARVRNMVIVEINESWRNATTEASIGAIPWYVGSLLAMGEFIGFCGDDDELLPEHVSLHVEAMREHEAMFSVSAIQFRAGGVDQFVVGPGVEHGNVDATGIMCHKDALAVASWSADGTNAADYRLVRDWSAAGLRGAMIHTVTGIHNDGWLAGKTGRPDRPR